MEPTKENVDAISHDRAFGALTFSLLGWALLEFWLLKMRVPGRTHVVPALIGVILITMAVRRSRLASHGFLEAAAPARRLRSTLTFAEARSALVLLGIGALLGLFIRTGSVVLLGAVVTPLYFAAWSRITLCHKNPVLSRTIVLGAVAVLLVTPPRAPDLMFFPLGCWVFWTYSCVSLLDAAARSRRTGTRAQAHRKDVGPVTDTP